MRLGIRFVVCSTLFFRIAIWARLCMLFSRIPLCLIQISQWNYLFRWERHIWRPATRNFVSICHERNMCENVKQNSYSTFIFTMISRVPEIRFHSRNKQQQNTLCIILPSNKFPQNFFLSLVDFDLSNIFTHVIRLRFVVEWYEKMTPFWILQLNEYTVLSAHCMWENVIHLFRVLLFASLIAPHSHCIYTLIFGWIVFI